MAAADHRGSRESRVPFRAGCRCSALDCLCRCVQILGDAPAISVAFPPCSTLAAAHPPPTRHCVAQLPLTSPDALLRLRPHPPAVAELPGSADRAGPPWQQRARQRRRAACGGAPWCRAAASVWLPGAAGAAARQRSLPAGPAVRPPLRRRGQQLQVGAWVGRRAAAGLREHHQQQQAAGRCCCSPSTRPMRRASRLLPTETCSGSPRGSTASPRFGRWTWRAARCCAGAASPT